MQSDCSSSSNRIFWSRCRTPAWGSKCRCAQHDRTSKWVKKSSAGNLHRFFTVLFDWEVLRRGQSREAEIRTPHSSLLLREDCHVCLGWTQLCSAVTQIITSKDPRSPEHRRIPRHYRNRHSGHLLFSFRGHCWEADLAILKRPRIHHLLWSVTVPHLPLGRQVGSH